MQTVIWTMWWQGEDAAPPVVRLCLASMRRHANGAQVCVLDRDNYRQYLTLPEHILQKTQAGQITLTHLSDIIRVQLLSQRGGLWLDSTVFVTRDIPRELFGLPFYSIRLPKGYYLPNGRWCGYVLGGTGPVFDAVRRMLEEYWKTHSDMVDYLLVDYCLDRCYARLPQARAAIDAVPLFEGGKGELIRNWSGDMRPEQLQGLFQKISWKRDFSGLTEDCLLGRLMTDYGLDWRKAAQQPVRKSGRRVGDYLRTVPRRVRTYGPAVVFWESVTAVLEGLSFRVSGWARRRRTRAVQRYLDKLPAFRIGSGEEG